MEENRQAGKLAKGGGEKGVGRRGKNAGHERTRISLAEQGIDKHLADLANGTRPKTGSPADPVLFTCE